MKVYVDDNSENVNIVQTIASASTLISSLAGEARSYILSKFPKRFFKQVYIDTSEAVTQQNRNDLYNPNANKIPYPTLAITPEISLDDPIGGMEKGMHLSSPNLYLRRDIRRTYNKLIVDPEEKFSVYYTSDYITTNFNFKITTNSFIQNTDMAFFLKSKFQKDFFQFLNERFVQTEIPKTFIKMISEIKGLDLNNPDDMDELRLYLIGTSKSQQSIQKKINNATGKQCFFVNDKCNLLTLFTDLDAPSSINRESQVEGEYVITFRLQVSCWLPNAFIMTINKSVLLNKIDKSIAEEVDNETLQQEEGFYTVSIAAGNEILSKKDTKYFFDSAGNKQIGHLVYSDTFMKQINEPFKDIILMDKMKPDFKKVYVYGRDILNLDMGSMIYLLIRTRDGYLPLDQYKLNYDGLILSINKDFDSDIAIAVYINRLMYESIKQAMESDKDYFNSNYLTSIISKIAGEPVQLVVKSFTGISKENNIRNTYTSDPNKALRVRTIYGIGYISLLDLDGTNIYKDGYRVCIGYDSENQPIIKQLEVKK